MASANDLQDLRLPEPTSLAPATTAFFVLFAFLLAVLGALAFLGWRRWKKNAYRRRARALLAQWRDDVAFEGTRAPALAKLPRLVKHVALEAWPRPEVAALTGQPWLAFLDHTIGGHAFEDGPGRHLPALAYDAPGKTARLDPGEITALFDLVDRWIGTHRA